MADWLLTHQTSPLLLVRHVHVFLLSQPHWAVINGVSERRMPWLPSSTFQTSPLSRAQPGTGQVPTHPSPLSRALLSLTGSAKL
jgi:hypothetical protein